MSQSQDLSRHPRFLQLEHYLRSKAQPGALPGRGDIDPAELKAMLPYINLFDVVREPSRLRFRFRLLGSAQSEALGLDCTGRFTDEVFEGKAGEALERALRCAVETREPHFAESHVALPDRKHVRFLRALFPLASDGDSVDMLIAAYVFPPFGQTEADLRLTG